MYTLDVAVPVPLRQTFAYTHDEPLVQGSRVVVPFGNRTLVGIVIDKSMGPQAEGKLKSISLVLDEKPAIDKDICDLCFWLAGYYHHPIGEVFGTVLPVILRKADKLADEQEKVYRLTDAGNQQDSDAFKRSPKQQALFTQLKSGEQTSDAIKAVYSNGVLNALQEKGVVEHYQRAKLFELAGQWVHSMCIAEKPVANKEQGVAISCINESTNSFNSILLEGVTGSGKTEVYLQTIEEVLKKGRQVLILVPEIGLTPQTVQRFEARFGIEVGLLHSQMNDTARFKVWQKSRAGGLGLVIGTRSAIFTPMYDLGMIIVDEEHDDSFKQQDGLRYHARDLAAVRAQRLGIPLVLGSATPSLESLNNALTGRYRHLTLTARAAGAQATRQQVFDIRDQQLSFGLSQTVLGVMRQHLSNGNQVMVFVNRRGYAPALMCHHCGESEQCHRCEKPFTVHKAHKRLQCHHCGATKPIPSRCSSCGSDNLLSSGIGTEQLEEGLKTLFPDVNQVRIDSDAVRGKDKLTAMLAAINNREYQLLVGTQILSKGHHFPHVTLVVVLDCDGALFSGDFRAPEKLAQLVTQLAGRAGRAGKAGEMWLQSHNPGHPLLQDLIHNGYGHFARHALLERKMALLPPFTNQIMIRAESHNGAMAHDFLKSVRQLIGRVDGVTLVGPMPTLLEKRQGRFRFMLLMQAEARVKVHGLLHHLMPGIQGLKLASKVRWSVDVDPSDFS